ncbi:MAG: FAD:protein FMN transferase [Firmicutes bacterium]|nr:FAD:protein FMN transferase [Bacillota bacterium]
MLVVSIFITLGTGCEPDQESEFTRYTNSFYDTFDTMVSFVAYTKTEAEFDSYFSSVQARFQELHKLYDLYNDYPGVNNIKTINDNAGIEPVAVAQELFDLIKISKEWYFAHHGRMNITLGPVLKIWHDYRTEGLDFPETAQIPPIKALRQAEELAVMENVQLDEENNTVFLSEVGMRLDIGAIAKGYAAELVGRELTAAGLESGAINAGGNIRTIGQPLGGQRAHWSVGIFDPDSHLVSADRNLDTVYINDGAVVSSGDYQRYYYVDGQKYHHLIDPVTLMPADYYRAVTVVCEDSGYADLVSTELFLLPYEKSRALADSLDDVEAFWVMPDGEIRVTEGLKDILHSYTSSDN